MIPIQILFVSTLLLPFSLFAQDGGKKNTGLAPKQAAPVKPEAPHDGAVKVEKMPEGVVEVRTDIFRIVDKDGKAWIYRRMPFGIFRSAETENMRQILADPPDKQNVRELPDGTLEFTKLTPFGVGRSVRKKEDLTEEEKEMWAKVKEREAAKKKVAKEQKK